MSWSVFLRKFDWVMVGIVVVIMALGILSFYHSGPKSVTIIQKQIFFSICGLAVMFLVSLFDYRIFKNYSSASIALYAVSIILLLVAFASSPVRGSRSWVQVFGHGFQPSEFVKLMVLILLAKYFSQKHAEIYNWRHIIASGIYVGMPAFLVLLQPDFGSMMIFVALWLGMLLLSGVKRRHLLTIMMIGLIIFSFAWFLVFKPYQKARILSFVDPYLDPRGIGYNAIQAQTTFGSGRVLGTIFEPGKKIAVLVPEQYTDFAFAAFGQKFGFAGVVALFGLLLILIARIGDIAQRTSNNFSKLFCLGLIIIISVHTLVNAGMNLGILPITGIPFSFISYGGSHLMTLMAGLGIVQSIRLRG